MKIDNLKKVTIKSEIDKKNFLLQVNDPTFPIGAFSHTYGMETYIVNDLIKDEEGTFSYIQQNLIESFLYSELLPASLAYDYAMNKDLDRIMDLDKLLSALKAAREIREASEKLGSRLAKNVISLRIELDHSLFEEYVLESQKHNHAMHYAVVNGVICASLDIDKQEMLQSFIYSNISGIVTNAVKSVPLKQTSGQQLLMRLYPTFNEILDKVKHCTVDDLALNCPGFEIRSMQHENIYTRIYIS